MMLRRAPARLIRLFVPFFWLDTVDGVTGTSNSYFTDSVGNISGATMSTNVAGGSGTTQRTARSRDVQRVQISQ
jgi:hypothetical protein